MSFLSAVDFITPFFIFVVRRRPSPQLFPYTTLFRSCVTTRSAAVRIALDEHALDAHVTRRGLEAHGEVRSQDRKSTRLNSSHITISYAVFCLKKKTHTRKYGSGYVVSKRSTTHLDRP